MEARCAEQAKLQGRSINWSDREIKGVWTGQDADVAWGIAKITTNDMLLCK
jgi:hypothetical protein